MGGFLSGASPNKSAVPGFFDMSEPWVQGYILSP